MRAASIDARCVPVSDRRPLRFTQRLGHFQAECPQDRFEAASNLTLLVFWMPISPQLPLVVQDSATRLAANASRMVAPAALRAKMGSPADRQKP